ncbi:MAG: sulfatase [Deltaproteobacteria bacterium]|nr:sulfatase [Deltaproteobacteria bacterium]
MRTTKKFSSYLFICTLGLLMTCSRQDGSPPPKESSESGAKTRKSAKQKLPNIVLFSIDTLRADRLGAYGYAKKTSPNIDVFAEKAVQFQYAISQAPSTAPAHMSIFTAMTPAVHRTANIGDDGSIKSLDMRIPTLIESLKEHGYYTAGFHGGGNVEENFGFNRGFHTYSQDLISYNWVKAYRDPDDLRVIRQWVELSRERRRPFFLFLHHYVCHTPYVSAPQVYRDRFLRGKKVEGLSAGVSDDTMYKAADGFDRVPSNWGKLYMISRVFANKMRYFWQGADLGRKDHNAHFQALYDSGVAYSDYLFAEVAKILKEEGVYDESIIVLLSDHGEEFFEHGGREHGRLFVEHLHVPLIIKFPHDSGIKPKVIAKPVRTMDVLPTLLSYLKLAIEHPVQGISFMPLVSGTGTYNPEIVSYGDPGHTKIRVERDGLAYTDAPHGGVAELLFERVNDPKEQNNIAKDRENVVVKMREIANKQRAADTRFKEKLGRLKTPGIGIDERLVEQLKQLGYLK